MNFEKPWKADLEPAFRTFEVALDKAKLNEAKLNEAKLNEAKLNPEN